MNDSFIYNSFMWRFKSGVYSYVLLFIDFRHWFKVNIEFYCLLDHGHWQFSNFFIIIEQMQETYIYFCGTMPLFAHSRVCQLKAIYTWRAMAWQIYLIEWHYHKKMHMKKKILMTQF